MSRARSHRSNRFGVMNHVGSIWTPETFETEAEAEAYLKQATVEMKDRYGIDLSGHTVVPVRVTVSPASIGGKS